MKIRLLFRDHCATAIRPHIDCDAALGPEFGCKAAETVCRRRKKLPGS